MEQYRKITQKLERFIRKYYLNDLLRGVILFVALGLLYLLLILAIEYIFWLSSPGRAVLFWTFVGVELMLLGKFVAIPLLRLFKLQKGIDYETASELIGGHFPEVSDKLLNTLQLYKAAEGNELVMASVVQKSEALEPVPFRMAINLRKNLKYLKYAVIPVVVFLVANYAGKERVFSSSYERVVNYNEAFVPPAPFEFFVVNDSLQAIENQNYKLMVRTAGTVVPQETRIQFNNETYFLQQEEPGAFSFVFEQPRSDIRFRLLGNKVISKPYTLEVLKVPVITGFEMYLDYPRHTGKRDETVKNTGNAIVPEGTVITWTVAARQTSNVELVMKDTVYAFAKTIGQDDGFTKERKNQADLVNTQDRMLTGEGFSHKQRLYRTTNYDVSTSNERLQHFENLSYTIQTVKDQYPKIELEAKRDTVTQQQTYFYGTVSDDYGLKALRLVYYPVGTENKQIKDIPIVSGTVDQFTYAFPNNLVLEEGTNYEYYFEVVDNDALHNFKSTKSTLFSFLKLTQSALEEQQLERQSENIQDLNKSLERMKEREKELEALSRKQKEKATLSFNDQRKLENFIKRQQQQEQLMKEYSKELKENLEEFQKEEEQTDDYKEMLKERLERQEKEAKKNEALLKELERLREKMNKEELAERLEKLSKQNKNSQKNLEQLVELTKRYYVQKKAEKLSEDLNKLAEKQEGLSEKEAENTKEAQEELNKEFNKLQEELDDLQKENERLKRPMDIPSDAQKQEEIEREQKQATEELNKQEQKEQQGQKADKSSAQGKQKKAAQKMKQMGDQMQQQMSGGGQEQAQEDADMLRQILDNLLVFSFEEENLMKSFRNMDNRNPAFAKSLRYQNILKQNFRHVDDSLYALSLRVPELAEPVNEALTDIDYNLDKSMERLADNQILQGVSSQQYVVTGANELADFLSNTLDQMQQAMMSSSGQGQGEGQGMQLPDIIKSQEELNEQMQQGMKEGEEGKEGQKGEQGKQGDTGEQGETGKKGSEGDQGQSGEGGDQDGKGEGGEVQNGEGGNGKEGKGTKGNKGQGEDEKGNQGDDGDYSDGLLYEIYKRQQDLRNQLEDAIKREGLGDDAQKLARTMEQVEQQLLDRGFNNEVMERMSQLKHELLYV